MGQIYEEIKKRPPHIILKQVELQNLTVNK